MTVLEQITFVVVKLFLYSFILSGCIFALTVGLVMYKEKKITERKYYIGSATPIIIGIVGLFLFNTFYY